MSELPRVNPVQPGVNIPPVRPPRRPGREPRKQRGEKKKKREREHTEEAPDEDAPTQPDRGGGIDLRV